MCGLHSLNGTTAKWKDHQSFRFLIIIKGGKEACEKISKQELFAKVDCLCILSMQSLMQMLIDVHITGICA